jgi:endonuclease YncB( thermonuclease family)
LLYAVALLLFGLWSFTASADVLEGRVVGVADGDTITLLDGNRQQHKIRLVGIDAPEKAQPYGQRSKQHLSDLAFGKDAKADCYARLDRWGRDICNVYVDGKDVGLAQLDAGLAWWFRKYAHEQYPKARIDYEAAEDRAAADRVGLWQDANPVPPWEWRRGH